MKVLIVSALLMSSQSEPQEIVTISAEQMRGAYDRVCQIIKDKCGEPLPGSTSRVKYYLCPKE